MAAKTSNTLTGGNILADEITATVIGLGKLGAPLAAVLASKGISTIGVDLIPEVVQALAEGRSPVEEPGLDELIAANRSRLQATTDIAAAVEVSDFTFIIVPTPSGPDDLFSFDLVQQAIEQMGPGLQRRSGSHNVVVTSTVTPGTMDRHIAPLLEKVSGRQVGKTVGLCYNPEFIALGSVIRNMLNPDFILIGESDPAAGAALEALQRRIVDNDAPISRMSFVDAELTKIAVNTFVTTKISFANMLANLCEHLPGSDVDVVTAAIGQDSRIGSKYLSGGMGYGGPCFPRDSVAFAALARSLGADADIAEATDRTNRRQIDRLFAATTREGSGGRVAILGLSYKPWTGVVEESQGVFLADRLVESGYDVSVFDPMAMPEARRELGDKVVFANSAAECIAEADTAVITTAWPEFKDLDLAAARVNTVIDCWRLLPPDAHNSTRIVHIGVGSGSWPD